VQRFRREALLQAMVKHPGAVSIIDLDETVDGILFIVMEYCPGVSLADVLDREGALPIDRALSIARQLLDILAVAHDSHIVHRDLKPENIMLEVSEDGEERVRVLDFGVATILEEMHGFRPERPDASNVWGTPWYIAPEQALGREASSRADIYSAGVVLYELLTGHLPLEDEDLDSFYARLINVRPPRLRAIRAKVPLEVDRVVMQALSKLPADRPATALAFKQALQERSRVRQLPRRLALALVALTLTILGFAGGRMSTIDMSRYSEQARETTARREQECLRHLEHSSQATSPYLAGRARDLLTQGYRQRRAGLHEDALRSFDAAERIAAMDPDPRRQVVQTLPAPPADDPASQLARVYLEAGDSLLEIACPTRREVALAQGYYLNALEVLKRPR
jgi:serine/threonine protein kinase